MPSILFVCTANQFRSPLAAALLRKLLETDKSTEEWRVESAGTWTRPGLPASPAAVKIAEHLGLPGLNTHRTRQVSSELLCQYDLILVMEQGQREALASEFPSAIGRTRLLTEAVDGLPSDIPDPVGLKNDLEDVASEMQELIENGGDKILKLAEALHRKHKEED
jgi:protein-tyrosine phosphatase